MKRYNITIESRFNNQRRIKITAADNGEWVRYEDVAEALELKSNLYDAELHHSEYMRQQNRDLQDRIKQLEATMKELLIAGAALGDDGPEQILKNYGGTNG